MSLFNILGFAAITEAKQRIESMTREDSVANGEDFAQEFSRTERELSSSDRSAVVANGLTSSEIEVLYDQVKEEADTLFDSFRSAYRQLSKDGDSPTRLDILRFISKTQSTIQFSMLNSNQINALIDFYIDHSHIDPNDESSDEQISSRLSPSQRRSAEVRQAEIMLEAIIMSSLLKSRGKLEKKQKKEKKEEKRRIETELKQFEAKLAQHHRKDRKKSARK